jgi:hypothetical protein
MPLCESLLPYFNASHQINSYSSFKRLDGMNLMECVVVYSQSPTVKAAAVRAMGGTLELVQPNGGVA